MIISRIVKGIGKVILKFISSQKDIDIEMSLLDYLKIELAQSPTFFFFESSLREKKKIIKTKAGNKKEKQEKEKLISLELEKVKAFLDDMNIVLWLRFSNMKFKDLLANEHSQKLNHIESFYYGKKEQPVLLEPLKIYLKKGVIFMAKGNLASKKEKQELIKSWNNIETELFKDLIPPILINQYDSNEDAISNFIDRMAVISFYIENEKNYLNFLNQELESIKKGDGTIVFEPLPEGYELINLNMTEVEIEHFFSFLYKVKDSNNKPYLSKTEVGEIFKYGFAVPPRPVDQFYDFNFSNYKNSKGALWYALYMLLRTPYLPSGKSISEEKTKVATFLKFYFSEFNDKDIGTIKNLIRGKIPKTGFELDEYFPKKAKKIN